MARGRHQRRRKTRALAIVGIIAGVFVLAVAGAALGAYRYERSRDDTILPGVQIAGVDVGGMTAAEAAEAVRAGADDALDRPIRIEAAGQSWTTTPRELGQEPDVDRSVRRALDLNDRMGVFSRFWHRVRGEAVNRDLPLRLGAPSEARALLDRIAAQVRVEPVDAAITHAEGEVEFVKAKRGRQLDLHAARAALVRAIRTDRSGSVTLATEPLAPEVTADSLGTTVIVRVDENKLYLYEGFKVRRTYGVATAKPGWTTPVGDWVVDRKAENPTWYNPALDSWGANLPAVVPGGPGNPMGTRAIYINAPGLIRIHGTTDPDSIGRYASHGCIRMQNEQIEKLYPLVPVGSHVIIAGYRPAGAQEWDTPATKDT